MFSGNPTGSMQLCAEDADHGGPGRPTATLLPLSPQVWGQSVLRTCCPEGAEQLRPRSFSSWPLPPSVHSEGGESLLWICKLGVERRAGHPRFQRTPAVPQQAPVEKPPHAQPQFDVSLLDSGKPSPGPSSPKFYNCLGRSGSAVPLHSPLGAQLWGFSPPPPQRTVFFWIGEQSCCPNPLAPGWRLSAERVPFCLISWVREMCQGQSRSLRNANYFPLVPAMGHGCPS